MSDAAYKRVRIARNNERPTGLDYIRHIFKGFIEFHGDRRYADDPAIVGGIAWLDGVPVTVIAIEKGHTAKERTLRNFGAPNPEGYRKALRLMEQADKFGRPVICFIDTSGAFCGIGAEERGQGQAIAENLMVMSTLCVPIISILIGEGGSGGALALAVADRVWTIKMDEHQRIDAFKLWCWRRLLRVPWTAGRSSQSILKKISPEYSVEGLKVKLQYFDHLMQRADSLEKTLMLGNIKGKRRRGQQRMRWLDGFTESMDMSLSKV